MFIPAEVQNMSPFFVMAIQSTLTIVIAALVARWYLVPSLATRPLREKLEPLLLVHAFRFVPLAIFLPGQVSDDFPGGLARLIAYGDFVSAVLALAALLAWRYREAHGFWLTALFSVVGTADMVVVLAAAMREHGLQPAARLHLLYSGILRASPGGASGDDIRLSR
ncbi:MAG: hypothetical protein WEC82_00700 [Xanthobacteraceae bacterium]